MQHQAKQRTEDEQTQKMETKACAERCNNTMFRRQIFGVCNTPCHFVAVINTGALKVYRVIMYSPPN